MAIENGVQNAELGYILDPAFQIENLNGKPVVGGYICIYEAGTDNKYISYENFDGAQNPFKIPLRADGRAVILGDPSLTYDVYAYDSYGNQLFSRLNVQCNVPGNISIKGADTRIKNTDGTLDISLQTMGNNVREYTINTRNKELGVESPLYFVRNDESATIIGFSGDGYLTEDKFEYDDNFNITGYDGSAFASNGQTYSAGTNIDITDNVISVTGLPTSSDVENAISSAVTNVENKFEYNENNYITAYNNSAFAGTNYSAGDYVSIENDTISVTGLQPSGDYATHDDLTAYQPSGDYATKEDVESATSGKQDTLSAGDGISIVNNTISVTSQGGGIEQVSHDDTLSGDGNSEPLGIANIEDFVKQNDLTAYQEKGDYYSASNPSGFITNDAITGLQPSGDYATHDDLTAYATTALVSSVSSELYSAFSGISGDYELVAGSGVELVDDPNAKTTTINVTAGGTPVTAIEQMIESATSGLQPSGDYATTADLTAKQDTLDYGYHDAAISSIDSTALYDTSAHARINTLAGRISNLSSDKLDTTAFSTVSGDFLTAHQDISNKLDTTAFSDVSGSFLTAVPDTYLQNTDLSTTDGKVTAISGIPLSAGGDVPEGVMVESAVGYNAVNEISGYNGSAIAQYGAEKQWLVHDDTLVHAANSAQYALGVNLSAVAQLLGVDETVLWTNTAGVLTATGQNFVLNESYKNFNKFKFCLDMDDCQQEIYVNISNDTTYGFSWGQTNATDCYLNWIGLNFSTDTTGSIIRTKALSWSVTSTQAAANNIRNNWEWTCRALTAIYGIGRKQ